MPRPRLKPGSSGSGAQLAALLGAERFRLGRRTARVRDNLERVGGAADERAPAWIGAELPPHGAPSVTLGEGRGTLGPHSFGFLDNARGVAPYAAALPERPRPGGIALVCARREALPEVAPLACARGLGVSWIVSVGDGDAGEVLAFLARDPQTRAVLLAAPASPESLAALGKPAVVLGGDPLTRAAARRAGGAAVDDLEAWLQRGALHQAGASPGAPLRALVVGGGAPQLAQAARAARVPLEVQQLDDEDQAALERALADERARDPSALLLLAGAGAPTAELAPAVALDLGQPEQVRALLAALADHAAPPAAAIPRARADRAAAEAIVAEAGGALSDHDAKRALKHYGVRVSRQAPAQSPTAAVRVAQQLGYPVDLVAGDEVRRAASAPELRRLAALSLAREPWVLVREPFPEAPRCRLQVKRARGLGAAQLAAQVGAERALLPLDRRDAILLAQAAGCAADPRPFVDLLARAAAAAEELDLTLDLELHTGPDPAVISASAKR